MERWANKLREITQGFVGSKRKTLIEYGVYGLRYAASTPWLNRKKKGSMAGYDPAKGRFGTYAINQAKWFMRQAVSAASKRPDQEGAWPLLLPRFVDKITEFREWAATEISTEVENSPEAKKSEIEELTQFFLYFVSPYTLPFDPPPLVSRGWEDVFTSAPQHAGSSYWHSQNRFRVQRVQSPKLGVVKSDYVPPPHRASDHSWRNYNLDSHLWLPDADGRYQRANYCTRDPQYKRADNPNCFCISATP
jgi:hypothetical protein